MAFRGNNVYIIGAGFSRAAGLPLMVDFYQKMRDVAALNDKVPRAGKEAIRLVQETRAKLTTVREKLSIDLDNIEELLSLIDAVYQAEDSSSRKVFEAIRKSISASLCSYEREPTPITVTTNLADRAYWTRELPTSRPKAAKQFDINPYDLFAKLITHGLDYEFKENEYDVVISFNYDLVLEMSRATRIPHFRLN